MAWPAESLHIKCNDNAANTVVVDSSANATNGTLAGGDNTSAITTTGKINSALSLNGTDDSINFGNILNLTGSYSFFCWFKSTDVTGIIASKLLSVASQYWYVYCNPSGKLNCRIDGATNDADAASTASINTGLFVHIGFTWDGTILRNYINASGDGTNTPASAIGAADNSGQLMIGRWDNAASGGLFLTEIVDDIRIYQGSCLTIEQISAIYNSGNGTEESLPSLEPNSFVPRRTLLGAG